MNLKLLFLTLFIALSSLAFSQVTINSKKVKIPLNKYFQSTKVDTEIKALPEQGENKIWDYSYFTFCKNCKYEWMYQQNENPAFPNSTFTHAKTGLALGQAYNKMSYYSYEKNGDFLYLGYEKSEHDIDITNFTGNPDDKLKGLEQTFHFNSTNIDYPLKYGKKWVESYTDTLIYILNSPTFQVSNTEIKEIRDTKIQHEVVGSGQLILPYAVRNKTKTFTYEAILVKSIYFGQNNYESKLPKQQLNQLLSVAGIKDVLTFERTYYSFYIKEFPFNVLRIESDKKHASIVELSKYPPKK